MNVYCVTVTLVLLVHISFCCAMLLGSSLPA